MLSTIRWKAQTDVLEEYAKNKGFTVAFEKADGVSWIDFSSKTIVIHNGSTEEIQFYHLMHELGHALQQANEIRYENHFMKIFNLFSVRSLSYRIKIIEEEIDAWNIGLKLAKRMGLKIQLRKYELIRARELATFLRYALKESS